MKKIIILSKNNLYPDPSQLKSSVQNWHVYVKSWSQWVMMSVYWINGINPILTLCLQCPFCNLLILTWSISWTKGFLNCKQEIQESGRFDFVENYKRYLNLRRYFDFGHIAKKRCQISPLSRMFEFLALYSKQRIRILCSGVRFGAIFWQWDQSHNTFWD